MSRNSSPHQQPQNPLAAPSVVGLDVGREMARRHQRRRRFQDSAATMVAVVAGIAVLAATVYIGYSIYDEQQTSDRLEAELRRTSLEQQGSGDDVRDAIEQLQDQPVWNGPGNPTFGVGDGDGG